MAAKASQISNHKGDSARRDNIPKQSQRKKNKKMSDRQLVSFLGRKINASLNDEDGDLSDVRKENFNYYVGAEYGSEREGYSKYVSREVLETVEWALPSVLRVFLADDEIVCFDPVGPEDVQQAKQETAAANYYVMKSNRAQSFLALHHWMKDALMYPNGYLKCYVEEATRTDVGTVTGINEMGVQMLSEDPEVEILEQRERVELVTQETPQGPQTQPIKVFDLKIRTTKQIMELRLAPVPPEECLVSHECTSLDLDEADFVCHRTRKSYTQLVEEGYDPDELDQVGSKDDNTWNDERVNRLFYEDEDPQQAEEADPSMRLFWVHECYARVDFDGDGLGERRCITMIGDRIFDNYETNYQPMIALSSVLMQHKHTGMSFVDIVKDLQLLSSTLIRQLLDNIYKLNVGKKYFSEDSLTEDGSTIEAMLNTQAEWVPVRGPANMAVHPDQHQSVVGELLPVIQHVDAWRAARTGVQPEATLDGNALQEVRQDVFANAMDRASQRIEMLVRIFAETGWRMLMLKVHQLLRSHWDIPKMIQLNGQWINVDPQGWRDRTDLTVNVGLGFNTKHQIMGMLVQMLSMQKEAAGQGLADAPKIYTTLEKLTKATGLGDVRMYFTDPNDPNWKPPEPPPDPNLILAQAQAQALQQEQQRKMTELQIKAQEIQAKAQAEQAQAQSAMADRELKMRELALREQELIVDGKLKVGELQAKIDELRASAELKRAQADKAQSDAAVAAVEAGSKYNEAVRASLGAAEGNPGQMTGEPSVGADTDDAGESDSDE